MDAPRIGLGCATLLDASLVDLIELAARHGFPTITVRPAAFAATIERGGSDRTLRRRLRDAGVTVRMIDALTACLPGESTLDPSDPAQRHLPREIFFPPDEATCFRAAEVLDAPIVNVTHFGQKPAAREAMRERLAGICRRAGKRGLSIALEFIPGTGIGDLKTADALARDCGEPNCAVTLDPWHWARSGGTLEDIRSLRPRAFAGMQLCDWRAEGTAAPYTPMRGRLMPGEGELPLPQLIEAVLSNTTGITIEAEIISDELRAMGSEAAAAHVAAGIARWREDLNRYGKTREKEGRA